MRDDAEMGLTDSPCAGQPAPYVVAAKLVVPALRPETVRRERVDRTLEAAVERSLTVVQAPAGYGKTTAVAQWLAGSDRAVAWVSLDAGDNDPRRMWAHLLAAVDGALPGAMDGAHRALRGGSDLHDTVLALAVQALAEHATGPLVLVLDDYQLVRGRRCHELLNALLDSAPRELRVVVCSRSTPPLRLGRRRVAGALTEVGVEQLRFDAAAAEQLLNGALGLRLTRRRVRAVDERVEGWAAGLALAGSSLHERGWRGWAGFADAVARSRGRAAQYLVEEVLEATTPELRTFLCRTSVLERMNGSLCEAVAADPSARRLLAQVRRARLFVTAVGADGEWVRYHPAFADVLGRELRERSPQLVGELHLRASSWFEQRGLTADAIAHATAAGDGSRAARLLHGSWTRLVDHRRYATVRRIIERLPPDRGELDGFCEALDVLCASLEDGDMTRTCERLQQLEARRDEPGVAAIVDPLRVNPLFGRVGEAVQAGWEAWARYPEPPEARLRIAARLAAALWFAGDRAAVRALLEPRLTQLAEHTTTRAWALATLALTVLEDGEPEVAERYADQAVAAVQECAGESAIEFGGVYVAHGAVLTARGRLEEADRTLRHAAQVTGKAPGSIAHAATLLFQARLDLARHAHRCARPRAAQARRILERFPDAGTLATRLDELEAILERRTDASMLGSACTAAELRVLALLPGRLTVAEIAAELHLSKNTVRSHVRRLYRRLGVTSRAEALAAARRRGLL